MKREAYFSYDEQTSFSHPSEIFNTLMPLYIQREKPYTSKSILAGVKPITNRYSIWINRINYTNHRGYYLYFEEGSTDIIHEVDTVHNIQYDPIIDRIRLLVFTKREGSREYTFMGVYKCDSSRKEAGHKYYRRIANTADFTEYPPVVGMAKRISSSAVLSSAEKTDVTVEDTKEERIVPDCQPSDCSTVQTEELQPHSEIEKAKQEKEPLWPSFLRWLEEGYSSSVADDVQKALSEVNALALQYMALQRPLTEECDLESLEMLKIVIENDKELPVSDRTQHHRYLAALSLLIMYVTESNGDLSANSSE